MTIAYKLRKDHAIIFITMGTTFNHLQTNQVLEKPDIRCKKQYRFPRVAIEKILTQKNKEKFW